MAIKYWLNRINRIVAFEDLPHDSVKEPNYDYCCFGPFEICGLQAFYTLWSLWLAKLNQTLVPKFQICSDLLHCNPTQLRLKSYWIPWPTKWTDSSKFLLPLLMLCCGWYRYRKPLKDQWYLILINPPGSKTCWVRWWRLISGGQKVNHDGMNHILTQCVRNKDTNRRRFFW